MQKHSTAKGRKGSTSKRSQRKSQPVTIEPPTRRIPHMPPLDWETYIRERTARWAMTRARNSDLAEEKRIQDGYANIVGRTLKQWTALGNLYADTLTNHDVPRTTQDALWENTIDPIMERVQINFSDPELLRVFWPLLCFLDRDGYSGGWKANPPDDEEEGGAGSHE